MTHDRLKPILQAICYACDYGNDTTLKADELYNQLFPLNQNMDNQHSKEALYSILHITLEILKELECTDVTDVEKKLGQNQD